MFEKPKLVIGITKNKVLAVLVKLRKREFLKTLELDWTPQNVNEVFLKISKSFKSNKIRILLADDISYVLNVIVPENVIEEEVEEYISQIVVEQIPEYIKKEDWNYRKADTTGNRAYIVFAPVKNVFESIQNAAKAAKLDIEFVEPEQLAKKRDNNPLIGIASVEKK